MTVLRLVTVGAFLFSIVIADNGNSMRPSNQPFRSSQPLPNPIDRDLFHPHDKNNPWLPQRIVQNRPNFGSPLNVPDSVASHTTIDSRYIQRVPKPIESNEEMMILEPMQRNRKSSWTDWVPDFFGDDSPPGPGTLIGPMEFPGISKKIFIRHNEPLDEDTNRVIIHLISRAPPTYGPPVTQSHPPQQYNQLPYYTADPMKQQDSYVTSGKSSVVSGDSWKNSETSQDKEVKDKKIGYPTHDRLLEVSNDPRYNVMRLKQSESSIPNAIWSRPPAHRGDYYGRSLNPTDSKGPVTFPPTNSTFSQSDNQPNLPQSQISSNVLNEQYETLRTYGYQNNTLVASESTSRGQFTPMQPPNHSPQDEISHLQQPLNNPDKTPLGNKVELNKRRGGGFSSFFDGSPIRTPRNQYSATNHFVRSSPPEEEFASGGLRIIPAPNLKRGPVDSNNSAGARQGNNSTGEDVMHSIMSMTASQSWKNVTSRSPKMIGEKKASEVEEKKTTMMSKPAVVPVIERRIDEEPTIEEETKEEQVPNESVPMSSSTATPVVANKTDKTEARMKEAVRKMMGSFSLWRHKVVSTKFLKELEEKQKHKKTKGSKRNETDASSQ